MPLVCRSCLRVNPVVARYCYHDGVALDGAKLGGGPIAVGAQPFLSPFVFPSGRICRNFDELALACDTDWIAARDLLKQGFLERFLGNLGRVDLALAARQAAAAPSLDRGLNDFLGKLPASTRDPAKLSVQPLEISLGVLTADSRSFSLILENRGMGLLYGSVSTLDTPWLAIGDTTNSPNKLFECRHDQTLSIHVIGKMLRASPKPIEGKLLILSNGGNASATVRIERPVKPYPDGLFAGCRSPRELAQKAKVAPRDAATVFEQGGVQKWYESNGWLYPVQGPSSSGIGAVQQFFEALGLVTPPKVEISERQVQLFGEPGAALEHDLQLRTAEKRPVYAHAVTDVPWLSIGRIVLTGASARVPLRVTAVPPIPGQQLRARVQVVSNGNQKFAVDVSLTITGSPRRQSRFDSIPVASIAVVPPSGPVLDIMPSNGAPLKTSNNAISYPAGPPPLPPAIKSVSYVTQPPPLRRTAVAPADEPVAAAPQESPGILKHFIVPLLLVLGLIGMLIHDYLVEPEQGPQTAMSMSIDPKPLLAVKFHQGNERGSRLLRENNTMRFGLTMLTEQDAFRKNKKLTFDELGRTNNTCLRIDGKDYLFGERPGLWLARSEPLDVNPLLGHPPEGAKSVWTLNDTLTRNVMIEVTQIIEIIPGAQSLKMDTCLVHYKIANKDGAPHRVGLRFLLDTYIGANDGVPFTIPGTPGLCDTLQVFNTPSEVPDYIEALENNNLSHPGTIARLQFRLGKTLEAPSRVILGGWPDEGLRRLPGNPQIHAAGPATMWDVPEVSMRALHDSPLRLETNEQVPPDSAVTMYWTVQPLAPGASREVGFAYGLGNVASDEAGHLGLSVAGRLVPGGEFTLNALVNQPSSGEKLTLTLPAGFTLVEKRDLTLAVPAPPAGGERRQSSVSWKIRAARRGNTGSRFDRAFRGSRV